MDIQDLRVFVRVAALQNLSSVGQEFSLTPGTISKRLQGLEDELGVRLFVRSTRSIRITEEGRILLGHAQRMLEEFDAAKATVDGNAASPRGLLKLSSPRRLGACDVGKGLSAFLEAYPEIELHAELYDNAQVLHEDGFDITFKTGELTDSSLIAKRLGDDPMIIVAAPSYLQAKGAPQSLPDLDKHTCLIHGDTCHWPFKRKSAEKQVRVKGRLRCNDIDTLYAAAIDGHGLLRVSASRAHEDIQQGLLVPVLNDFDTTGSSAIWAVYPKSRHMLPRMRVLIDFFSDWLRTSGPESRKHDRTHTGCLSTNTGTVLREQISIDASSAVEGEKKPGGKKHLTPARRPAPSKTGSRSVRA